MKQIGYRRSLQIYDYTGRSNTERETVEEIQQEPWFEPFANKINHGLSIKYPKMEKHGVPTCVNLICWLKVFDTIK